MQTLGWSTELKTLKKMFVVLGGSVDRCGSVRVTIALMLMTLDIDYTKPVMKGKTVQRINCASEFNQGLL